LRLVRAEQACGCPEGAVAALGAISVYAVFVVWPSINLGPGPLTLRILGAAGVLLLSAGLGKLTGRSLAAWRARRLRGRLANIRALRAEPS
jgi:hypothetical protein